MHILQQNKKDIRLGVVENSYFYTAKIVLIELRVVHITISVRVSNRCMNCSSWIGLEYFQNAETFDCTIICSYGSIPVPLVLYNFRVLECRQTHNLKTFSHI